MLGPELDSQYTFGKQDLEEWVYNLSPGEAETSNYLGLTSQTPQLKASERVPPPKKSRWTALEKGESTSEATPPQPPRTCGCSHTERKPMLSHPE